MAKDSLVSHTKSLHSWMKQFSEVSNQMFIDSSSYMYSSGSTATTSAVHILDLVGTISGSGIYEAEAISRVLLALGTVLLIPGVCGEKAK